MELWALQNLCTDNYTFSVTETIAIFLSEQEANDFLEKLEDRHYYGELKIEKVKTGELL